MRGGIEERRVWQNRRAGVRVMPRPTILTQAALAHVTSLVDQGRSAAEIAGEIGCTLGTLRVRCSQLGISLRRSARASRREAVTAIDLVPLAEASLAAQRKSVDQVYTAEQSRAVVSSG
jgi:hypothetical protein